MVEIVQDIKDARQHALLGNYERSVTFFKGIMHDLNQLIQNHDETRTKVSKIDLQKYRQKIEAELKQVEELNGSINAFRSMLSQPPSSLSSPSAHQSHQSAYNHYNNHPFSMGGGAAGIMPGMGGHMAGAGMNMNMNYGNPYYNDQFEAPERDPDVWPAPPSLKNNRAGGGGNGGGYQMPNSNYSPKHKDYKGKQVSGSDSKMAGNNGKQMNKSKTTVTKLRNFKS